MEVVIKNPVVLKSQEKVSVEDVVEFGSSGELIEFLARRKINDLSNSGLRDILLFMQERLGVDGAEVRSSLVADVLLLYNVRNAFVHNGGFVGDGFIKKYPGHRSHKGRKIKMDTKFGDSSRQCLIASVRSIDEFLVDKFDLECAHESVDDVLSSIASRLPERDAFSSEVLAYLDAAQSEKNDSVGS